MKTTNAHAPFSQKHSAHSECHLLLKFPGFIAEMKRAIKSCKENFPFSSHSAKQKSKKRCRMHSFRRMHNTPWKSQNVQTNIQV